ncbi:MAG: alpha/beta hydrolase [Pseudomonadota bacterium]
MKFQHDGTSVFAADQGREFDPQKPTILFVHGAGLDHSVWPLQARHFAYRGWNALAIDLPGHGRSKGALLTSIEAMADWLAEIIKALGIKRAALVGHSMGALVVLACAARKPKRVSQIALLGAAPRMPVHPTLLEAAARPETLAPRMICDWAFGPTGHFGGHRSPGSWMLGHGRSLLDRAAGPRLHTDLAACNAYENGLAAAARITCPALVVAGAVDRMTPARQGAKLAEAIPRARFLSFPQCGHMMIIERPDSTRDALDGFLSADKQMLEQPKKAGAKKKGRPKAAPKRKSA